MPVGSIHRGCGPTGITFLKRVLILFLFLFRDPIKDFL